MLWRGMRVRVLRESSIDVGGISRAGQVHYVTAARAVTRGHNSVGRVRPLQGRSRGFESPWLHQ